MALKVPPPSRIAIGSATVAGQQVEVFLHPEWARYFESLTTQSNDTAAAVGFPGAPGTTGAAGLGLSLSDSGESIEFVPGPTGNTGAQGAAGAALFMVHDDPVQDMHPMLPTHIDEGWIAPTLTNSWVNFGAGTNPAGYYKDSAGIVRLRGSIKSGTLGTVAFTLPVGYRPAFQELYAVNSNNAFGAAFISANGDVTAQIGSTAVFTLDGITFRASGTY